MELQAVGHLDLASVQRRIEHANAITELSTPSERHFSSGQHALAAPGPFALHGRRAGVKYESRLARRAPSNLGVYMAAACHEELDGVAGPKRCPTLYPAT